MYDKYLHAYEKISLSSAGIVMGALLLVLHVLALAKPQATKAMLNGLSTNEKAARGLLTLDFVWLFLLILDVEWNPRCMKWYDFILLKLDVGRNPLCMNLYDFNGIRSILLIVCPVVWFVLYSRGKDLLFPRALGFFLLLACIVPMTAAFLKEPVSRLLIPCWCYPVLTVAMFWVGKPYLFRDWMEKYTASPRLYTISNAIGAVWGAAILLCAVCFW